MIPLARLAAGAAVLFLVLAVLTALHARGEVHEAQEAARAASDSTATLSAALDTARAAEALYRPLVAFRDSVLRADSTRLRQEAEDAERRAGEVAAGAAEMAAGFRAQLDSTLLAAHDSLEQAHAEEKRLLRETVAAQREELTALRPAYNALARAHANALEQVRLHEAKDVQQEATIAAQLVELEWHRNPPLGEKIAGAVPNVAAGAVLAVVVVYAAAR